MNNLTVIIPCAPHHADIVQEAINSVYAQTLDCELIVIYDNDRMGAGHARNRGLEQVITPLVSFLDSDDILEPDFAKITLGILEEYAQSHTDTRYVYTDWYGDQSALIKAPLPCDVWVNGPMNFHLVNAVVPTNRARAIGGFDEMMQGAEDADFYVRLRLSGVCGIHTMWPLVHYRAGGQRSIQARMNGAETAAKIYMTNRYGSYNLMGCCGDNTAGPTGPTTEPKEGDVLVQALWHGNRQERGRVTGALYTRTAFPKMLYVNEADANASPHLWKRVTSPMQASNGVVLQPAYKSNGAQAWQLSVDAMFGGGTPQPVAQPVLYNANISGRKKSEIVQKAQEWTKIEGDIDG